MPEYKSNEWRAVEEEAEFEVAPRHFVDLQVSCTKPVQVFGLLGQASTLLKTGQEFRFRGQVKGFEKILVKGVTKTPFGLRLVEEALSDGEYNSGEKAPVVSMPEPSNLLLKMRNMAREHHMRNRMPVLEPDEYPSFGRYEIDDDVDEVLFEEEAIERYQEKRKKEKEEAEAKARKDAEAKAAPQAPAAPQEPPSPKPPKEPPKAQEAAE